MSIKKKLENYPREEIQSQNGKLYSTENKWTTMTCKHMDESLKYNVN